MKMIDKLIEIHESTFRAQNISCTKYQLNVNKYSMALRVLYYILRIWRWHLVLMAQGFQTVHTLNKIAYSVRGVAYYTSEVLSHCTFKSIFGDSEQNERILFKYS